MRGQRDKGVSERARRKGKKDKIMEQNTRNEGRTVREKSGEPRTQIAGGERRREDRNEDRNDKAAVGSKRRRGKRARERGRNKQGGRHGARNEERGRHGKPDIVGKECERSEEQR